MGRNSSSSKGRRRQRKNKSQRRAASSNFLSEAGPGCFIARKDLPQPDWMVGWEEDVNPGDYEGQDVPDVALDPEDCTLSICNIHATTRVCYVTVYEAVVRDERGNILEAGSTTDNAGTTRSCVTFIVLCPPRTFAHLCYLDIPEGKSLLDIQLDSDVQDWNQHPAPNDTHPLSLGFPLVGSPFLCTQGEGGQLTHFFSGNLHAIDFRCDIGTPVLAVADGVVLDIKDDNTLTGVAVSNLFQWNSVLLQIDTEGNDPSEKVIKGSNQDNVKGGPLFVEYVHIQAKSATVKPGDRVTRGQVLCCSGSVGFSPEPHLHFAAYRSREPTAPTVRVRFHAEGQDKVFLPKAGVWYDENGSVEKTK